ncbi:hypothetical protein AB4511_07810 [Vibrio sp. 10N.222.54.F6]|uniref:hypothetical protein n=1 Tax=unclassified Vibrio TaxID=2614977 RepID=UPI000C8150A9|nr:hypothetical protein [Vibrio sp. 10N.261.51.A7]PML67569.1 hypothetical protein BCT71_02320 [Vibrio sp. 10N.261.51.A7]
MKLYFLVEGLSSEMQVYPEWVKHIIPDLETFTKFSDFKASSSGCFFFSGEGYPSILGHIGNAITDITDDGSVDYFFVILDADEDSVDVRKQFILDEVNKVELPERLHVVPVVQSRCFETVLLGNSSAIPRFAKAEPLISYFQYYNVIKDDPELMGRYNVDFTHSQFHAAYAMKALRERRINYSKSNCSAVANPDYFSKICLRVKESKHLLSLVPLIEALEEVANKMK